MLAKNQPTNTSGNVALRIPIPVAIAALFMGVAVLPPVLLDYLERNASTALGVLFAASGCLLAIFGIVALILGLCRKSDSSPMPSGARLAITANLFFLAFFSLEFSDLTVRHGKFLYWTNFLFLPTLLLFWGLVTTRRWAWWVSRIVAGLGVVWFVAFSLLIPFGNIARNGVPAPWNVRLFMICVSLGFAGVLAFAFWSIGRPETRRYFGMNLSQAPPSEP